MGSKKDKAPQLPNVCPRCSWNLQNLTPPVTEEEKQEYVRSVLGNRPYAKKYDLFQGKLTLLFATISSEQSEHLAKVLGQIPVEDPNYRATESLKVKLLFYLKEYNDTKLEIPAPNASYEDLQKEFTECFQVQEDVISIFLRTSIEFNRLLTCLANAAFDENFWQGAGLG